MAWPTRARSNPAGERPRLSGHTFDIAFGKLNPLHGSQHSQEDGDTNAERLEASDRIMAYGFGKPPQAIEAHFQERKHQILEVRWMPPDPNDHSKLIEPEPD
jgi:hypothetical protein